MAEIWGAALAVVGTGVSMYGANKQAKAAAGAQAASEAAQAESQRQNWMTYLASRGVAPGGDTQVGQIPGYAPGAAVNTRLPMWAKVIPAERPKAVGPAAAGGKPLPYLIKKG